MPRAPQNRGATPSLDSAVVSLDQTRGSREAALVSWFVLGTIPQDSVLAVHLHDARAGSNAPPLVSFDVYGHTPQVVAQSWGGRPWTGRVSYQELWDLASAGQLSLDVHTPAGGPKRPALVARLRVSQSYEWTEVCT